MAGIEGDKACPLGRTGAQTGRIRRARRSADGHRKVESARMRLFSSPERRQSNGSGKVPEEALRKFRLESAHTKPPEAASCCRKAAGRFCLGHTMSPAWNGAWGSCLVLG